MRLLDQLRQEAEAIRNARLVHGLGPRSNPQRVEHAMRHAYDYLLEAFKQLEVIRPVSALRYVIPHVGTMDGLRLTETFVDYRKKWAGEQEYFVPGYGWSPRADVAPRILRYDSGLQEDAMDQIVPREVSAAVRGRCSTDEWDARVQLAACYRLASKFRMTDLIYTHISARVPGPHEHFLINAYGLTWDEISASTLVKVDLAGNILEDVTGFGINPAGYVIHSAIHGARHDVQCVMHTHSRAGVAVSAQQQGLLPISQHSMRFYGRISYHDYEGVVLDMDEKVRLVANLGTNDALILRNHGLLTTGRQVRETFDLMYYLETACQIQIDAMAGGAPLIMAAPAVAERVAQQFLRPGREAVARDWPALLRMLDRDVPSYRD